MRTLLRKRSGRWLCGALVAALGVAGAQGQSGSSLDRLDRFSLFNECRPMKLVMEDLSDDSKEIRLTEDRLRLAAESRLRAARLYTDSLHVSNAAYLYIKVHVLGRAYSIDVEYSKAVFDEASDDSGMAVTWQTGSLGTHGQDAGFIVQNLSEHLDRFLAAYLRVNEPACVGR